MSLNIPVNSDHQLNTEALRNLASALPEYINKAQERDTPKSMNEYYDFAPGSTQAENMVTENNAANAPNKAKNAKQQAKRPAVEAPEFEQFITVTDSKEQTKGHAAIQSDGKVVYLLPPNQQLEMLNRVRHGEFKSRDEYDRAYSWQIAAIKLALESQEITADTSLTTKAGDQIKASSPNVDSIKAFENALSGKQDFHASIGEIESKVVKIKISSDGIGVGFNALGEQIFPKPTQPKQAQEASQATSSNSWATETPVSKSTKQDAQKKGERLQKAIKAGKVFAKFGMTAAKGFALVTAITAGVSLIPVMAPYAPLVAAGVMGIRGFNQRRRTYKEARANWEQYNYKDKEIENKKQVAKAKATVAEAKDAVKAAKKGGDKEKVKEAQKHLKASEAKVKELKKQGKAYKEPTLTNKVLLPTLLSTTATMTMLSGFGPALADSASDGLNRLNETISAHAEANPDGFVASFQDSASMVNSHLQRAMESVSSNPIFGAVNSAFQSTLGPLGVGIKGAFHTTSSYTKGILENTGAASVFASFRGLVAQLNPLNADQASNGSADQTSTKSADQASNGSADQASNGSADQTSNGSAPVVPATAEALPEMGAELNDAVKSMNSSTDKLNSFFERDLTYDAVANTGVVEAELQGLVDQYTSSLENLRNADLSEIRGGAIDAALSGVNPEDIKALAESRGLSVDVNELQDKVTKLQELSEQLKGPTSDELKAAEQAKEKLGLEYKKSLSEADIKKLSDLNYSADLRLENIEGRMEHYQVGDGTRTSTLLTEHGHLARILETIAETDPNQLDDPNSSFWKIMDKVDPSNLDELVNNPQHTDSASKLKDALVNLKSNALDVARGTNPSFRVDNMVDYSGLADGGVKEIALEDPVTRPVDAASIESNRASLKDSLDSPSSDSYENTLRRTAEIKAEALETLAELEDTKVMQMSEEERSVKLDTLAKELDGQVEETFSRMVYAHAEASINDQRGGLHAEEAAKFLHDVKESLSNLALYEDSPGPITELLSKIDEHQVKMDGGAYFPPDVGKVDFPTDPAEIFGTEKSGLFSRSLTEQGQILQEFQNNTMSGFEDATTTNTTMTAGENAVKGLANEVAFLLENGVSEQDAAAYYAERFDDIHNHAHETLREVNNGRSWGTLESDLNNHLTDTALGTMPESIQNSPQVISQSDTINNNDNQHKVAEGLTTEEQPLKKQTNTRGMSQC